MIACSSAKYKCSHCDYTTMRTYNYERHMNTVHNISLLEISQKVAPVEHNCSSCYKQFNNKFNLKRHEPVCKKIAEPTQCKECHKIFASRTTLYHHKEHCKGTSQSGNTNNYNNCVINNNNTVNVNILTCPTTRDHNFNFNCENITYEVLMKILNFTDDSNIRFNSFVRKLLENPVNQVIKKTNPKDVFSMVHRGEGKWEMAYDSDTLPVLTHHMTTAALGKTIEFDNKPNSNFLKAFQKQIQVFNELDYESSDYKETITRLKVHIINITREVMEEADRIQV